jgi:hypothetical protein
MGTRGLVGFTADNKNKFTYNHFDSYPDGLGDDVVRFVQEQLLPKLRLDHTAVFNSIKAIRMIQEGDTPTIEDVERLEPYTDLQVSTQSVDDWYCLLRHTQGDIPSILNCGYMIDSEDFITDSLFCEYAYVVNLDTNMLECYNGFQSEPHTKGRFASSEPTSGYDKTYYPCALVGEFPLSAIPGDWKEQAYPEEYAEDEG